MYISTHIYTARSQLAARTEEVVIHNGSEFLVEAYERRKWQLRRGEKVSEDKSTDVLSINSKQKRDEESEKRYDEDKKCSQSLRV